MNENENKLENFEEAAAAEAEQNEAVEPETAAAEAAEAEVIAEAEEAVGENEAAGVAEDVIGIIDADGSEEIGETGEADEADPEAVNPEENVEDGTVIVEDAEEIPAPAKKKSALPAIAAIIIILVIAAGALVIKMLSSNGAYVVENADGSKVTLDIVNTSGMTLAEVEEQLGMTHEEFLEQYQLPEDMSVDTPEAVAFYAMPVKTMASMYGMDFETLKAQLNIPDATTVSEPKGLWAKLKSALGFGEKSIEITEDTIWYLVENETELSNYLTEEDLPEFREEYGLGEEITLESRYKDIRGALNAKMREALAEAEKEEQENNAADAQTDTGAEADTDAQTEADTAADGAADGEAAADTAEENQTEE